MKGEELRSTFPLKEEEIGSTFPLKGGDRVDLSLEEGGDWADPFLEGEVRMSVASVRLHCARIARGRTVLQCRKFKEEVGAPPAILELHTEKEIQLT